MSSPLLIRLKREFDSSFEREVKPPAETLDVMYLSIAERKFALRIEDVKGVAKLDKLIAVPSRAETLAGVTGLRGEVLPVYDLAKILKLDPGHEPLRWLVTVSTQGRMLALGFAAIVGYDRITMGAIDRGGTDSLVNGTVASRGERVGLIDVQAVVKRICMEAEN